VNKAFDCSDVFLNFDHAHCRIEGTVVSVQLQTEEKQIVIVMDPDRIQNFLERIRKYTPRGTT